ncbi:MAG: AAC(3) family N-acetyltransferase [Proteobacteria bacterium]|nr:AAC(3) family N-acetyltransferase [Pseudomonadota bacterium]
MSDERDGLVDSLEALGVRHGDTVMVHASMRRVGMRAEVLLDAIEAAVGPDGHIMMLVCAPEGRPFDPAVSPAWAELGVLGEVFRTRSGVVLNEHPVARMGVWGKRATALVLSPPLDDYYGPGSPLERLVRDGGKVLRLGADSDTVTLFHYAEYVAAVPNKRRRNWSVDVVGAGGIERIHGTCLDDNAGIRDWAGEQDYFAQILIEYIETGRPQTGRVGGAACELIDAEDATRFAVGWLENAFG